MTKQQSQNLQATIRPATQLDIDAVVRLVNAGGPEGKPRKVLPNVLPPGYSTAFETISRDPHQRLMVVEQDDEIVGTFHLSFLTYLHAAGQPDLQIEAIHVMQSHRSQGLGTMMLEWAIAEGKKHNCRRMQLTTDKQRTEAHALYQRLGFVFSHEGAKLML